MIRPRCPFVALFVALSLAPHARGEAPLDQIAHAVKDGSVRISLALTDGSVPAAPGFRLLSSGLPVLHLSTAVRDGRVRSFCGSVGSGKLVLRGSGLRPSLRIDEIDIDDQGAVRAARFRGEGFYSRLLVSLFGGLARKQLGKLRFHTEVPDLLNGNLLVSEAAPARAARQEPAIPEPAVPASPSFLPLVDQVRVEESSLTTFEGRPLDLGDALHLETDGSARLTIDEAIYRPETAAGIPLYRVSGSLDGTFADGRLSWEGNRLAFRRGSLRRARFRLEEGAVSRAEVSAQELALELTSGRFEAPGGISIALAPPSRFSARELTMSPSGDVAAVLDLDLSGETGEIRRGDDRLVLAGAHVTTRGLRLSRGRATGDLKLGFDYRLVHPLVVRYPIPELSQRNVPLEFTGPFVAELHLTEVGAGSRDSVTGAYTFEVSWPPVEKAVFEAVRARWVQEVSGLRQVGFEIEPTRFTPCGEDCFLARFRFRAQKVGKGRSFLSVTCEPEGQASLVIDKDSRRFLLRGLKTTPHCDGVLGAIANLIAPLLTKTYEDLVLFQMPKDVPFTIVRVGGDEKRLRISGGVDWTESPGR